jgi:CelD/BcsL family acetyltransferase involved in cellulose biosynthesis
MPLQVVEEEFGRLQAEWEGLLSLCPHPSPFVHPAFQRAWADAFLGEPGAPEPALWSVREGERLIGVAPMLRDDSRLTLWGDPSVCDYADVVCTPGYEEAFLAQLLASAPAGCRSIDFWGLREDSPTLAALEAAASIANFEAIRELEAVAPAVDLPDSWDAYLAGLSKKDRHELRRKIRRFGALGGGTRVRAVTGGPELTQGASILRELMAMSRQDKLEFLRRPQMETFFSRLIDEMGAAGLIRLYLFRHREPAVHVQQRLRPEPGAVLGRPGLQGRRHPGRHRTGIRPRGLPSRRRKLQVRPRWTGPADLPLRPAQEVGRCRRASPS